MKFLMICFALSLHKQISYAQHQLSPNIPFGRLSAYHKKNNSMLSVTCNPASCLYQRSFSVLLYTEKRFLINELNFIEGMVYIPIQQFDLMLDYTRFGFSQFNQTSIGFNCSRPLTSLVDVGLAIRTTLARSEKEKWNTEFGFAVGVIFHQSENFSTGLVFTQTKTAESNFNTNGIPLINCAAGFGYQISDGVNLGLQCSRAYQGSLMLMGSLQFQLKELVQFEIGYQSGAQSFFAGATMKNKFINVGFFLAQHPNLGITPGFMIESFNNKKAKW